MEVFFLQSKCPIKSVFIHNLLIVLLGDKNCKLLCPLKYFPFLRAKKERTKSQPKIFNTNEMNLQFLLSYSCLYASTMCTY